MKRPLCLLLAIALAVCAPAGAAAAASGIPYYNSYTDLRDAHPDVADWSGGCYVCAIAMILSALGRADATPYDIWKLNGGQVYIASWQAIADAYDVKNGYLALEGTAEEKEAAIRALCAENPQGVFVAGTRNKGTNHAVVAYLDGAGTLRIHNPGYYGYDARIVGDTDRDFSSYGQFYACRTFTGAGPAPAPAAPAEGVRGFVERLYSVCFGRAPEGDEADGWIEVLTSGKQGGVSVAHDFVFSQEFLACNYSDADYVRRLYLAFMGREAEPEGLDAWLKAMQERGESREQVFDGFGYSDEFAAICAGYGISPGQPAEGVRGFVSRLYEVCLGRTLEGDEGDGWVEVLTSGKQGGVSVAHDFVFSQEFLACNYSDADYVRRLYLAFMGREAEQEGLDAWLKAMQERGESREQVFDGFGYSEEFAAICAGYGIAAE